VGPSPNGKSTEIRNDAPSSVRNEEKLTSGTTCQTKGILAGAGGIEPCNNPLPHKDFSIPARPFDSIFDSKALVGMTNDEVAYRGQGLESERRSRAEHHPPLRELPWIKRRSFEVRHARRRLPAESALMSAAQCNAELSVRWTSKGFGKRRRALSHIIEETYKQAPVSAGAAITYLLSPALRRQRSHVRTVSGARHFSSYCSRIRTPRPLDCSIYTRC
jgi:hypothetical protein